MRIARTWLLLGALWLALTSTAAAPAVAEQTPAGTRAGTVVAPMTRWRAPLGLPLRVDRTFSAPSTSYGPGHRGVDLRGALGQPVGAAGPGRISYAGVLAGRGVVTVTHASGLRTTYEPLTVLVRVGQTVGAGQVLGRLTAGHCRDGGPCLHWGLLRGTVYLDPLSLLGPTRVRLLPLDGAGRAVASGSPGSDSAATSSGGRPDPHPARAPTSPALRLSASNQSLGLAALATLSLGLYLVRRRPPEPSG